MQGAKKKKKKKICIHEAICIEWSIYFIALKLSVVDGLVAVVMVVETVVVVEVASVDPAARYVRMLQSFKVKGWLSLCTILFILYSTEAHEVGKNIIYHFS